MKLRIIFLACLILAAASWLYSLWDAQHAGGGILHPPPVIPVLSAAELTALPDARLLERVERECLRRLFAADADLRSAAKVLSPPACHLWTIGYGESILGGCNLRHALMAERNPQCSPNMPTLKQMAESYRALGLPGAAQALEDALRVVDPGDDNDPYAAVQARYHAEIATRSAAARLAYARAHRSELFPAR
jgi:hypothetical protein